MNKGLGETWSRKEEGQQGPASYKGAVEGLEAFSENTCQQVSTEYWKYALYIVLRNLPGNTIVAGENMVLGEKATWWL